MKPLTVSFTHNLQNTMTSLDYETLLSRQGTPFARPLELAVATLAKEAESDDALYYLLVDSFTNARDTPSVSELDHCGINEDFYRVVLASYYELSQEAEKLNKA
jgi:hypothetical protein